ncbi:hypothetical protein BB560_006061, partial [Smittium megazygosporum]
NTPETIEHMLIECFRWNSIRHETTIFNIPRLYRTVTIDQSTNNQALNQGRGLSGGVGSNPTLIIILLGFGGLAQMVERSLSMLEVQGSIPWSSSNKKVLGPVAQWIRRLTTDQEIP